MTAAAVATDSGAARAFAVRVFLGMLATQELLAMYVGVQLGLYECLADGGPATPGELSVRASIAPRYAREWLEQQAVAGVLSVDDPAKPAADRAYAIPPGYADVLTASDNPLSMISLAVLPLGGIARALPALLDAYRTGAGVPDAEFGDDWRNGHSGANRALFTHSLARWIRSLPDVHAQLATAGARAADVGCGAGWAAIALARAYPALRVDGFDVDERTLEMARDNATRAGVGDRVEFVLADAASMGGGGTGGYDLVCVFDALHEMARPVEVLRSCRAMRAPGGTVLVMDAKVAERFIAPGDEIERFQYATSILHCLPACLAEQPSAGTGTVMRPDTVREYAGDAGFADVRLVPADDRFHRLYRLVA